MILPGDDPNYWRFYHDKCKRDANVREGDDEERRLLQGEEEGPDIE
jgi:hypothetical protein